MTSSALAALDAFSRAGISFAQEEAFHEYCALEAEYLMLKQSHREIVPAVRNASASVTALSGEVDSLVRANSSMKQMILDMQGVSASSTGHTSDDANSQTISQIMSSLVVDFTSYLEAHDSASGVSSFEGELPQQLRGTFDNRLAPARLPEHGFGVEISRSSLAESSRTRSSQELSRSSHVGHVPPARASGIRACVPEHRLGLADTLPQASGFRASLPKQGHGVSAGHRIFAESVRSDQDFARQGRAPARHEEKMPKAFAPARSDALAKAQQFVHASALDATAKAQAHAEGHVPAREKERMPKAFAPPARNDALAQAQQLVYASAAEAAAKVHGSQGQQLVYATASEAAANVKASVDVTALEAAAKTQAPPPGTFFPLMPSPAPRKKDFAVPLPRGRVISGTAAAISNGSAKEDPGVALSNALAKEDLGEVTLLIRNIPARCTQAQLLEIWEAQGRYNMLHLPYDHHRKCNAGKAFVNFISRQAAIEFQEKWQGQQLIPKAKVKGLNIAKAEVQGFEGYIRTLLCHGRIKKKINMPAVLSADGSIADFRKIMDVFLKDVTHLPERQELEPLSSRPSSEPSTPDGSEVP